MSYNKIKFNDESPDSSGNIPVKMSSYITESNPQNSQLIQYNGSEFVNSSVSINAALNLKLGLHGYNFGWGQSTKTYQVGDYYTLRDYGTLDYKASGFDFNNATSANTPNANTRWMESIDIPDAGQYLFICSIMCRNNTSLTVRCSNKAGNFGVKCIAKNTGNQSPFVFGIADCVNNDIFKMVVVAEVGSTSIMSTPGSKLTSILIFKLD